MGGESKRINILSNTRGFFEKYFPSHIFHTFQESFLSYRKLVTLITFVWWLFSPEAPSKTVSLLISKSWSDTGNSLRYSLMVTLLSKYKSPYLIEIHTKSAIPVTKHTRGSDRILHLHGRRVYSVCINCWVWVLRNFEKYVNPEC